MVVNVPTTTAVGGVSSFRHVTPTSDDSASSTVTADAINNTGATGTSAGTIAGGVIGGLLGLAAVGFIIAFILVSLFFSPIFCII